MKETGRRDQAQPIYEQILRIKPDHAVALNNPAFIKADKGIDLDQALTTAQRARQQQPASPDFADTLGWIYIQEESAARGCEYLHRFGHEGAFQSDLSPALRNGGDKTLAKCELEMAMRNPPVEEKAKIQEMLQKL